MTYEDEPKVDDNAIIVHESAVPGAIGKLVRQILLMVGGSLVARGMISQDTSELVLAISMLILPLAWGQVRGLINHYKLVDLADEVTDDIAKVVRK